MHTATRTIEYPGAETQTLLGTEAMPTGATRLARVGRVHGDVLATGPFCLVRNHTPKTSPRCITDAFSQTMIVKHTVHFQILNCNQSEAVDYPAGMLVREIVSTPLGALMHTGHYFASLRTGERTPLLPRQKTIGPGKSLFLRAKEARISNLITSGESGKRGETNVYTDLLTGHGQSVGFPLAREGDVPLARTAPANTYSLGRTLYGTMEYHPDRADFGQMQNVTNKVTPTGSLRITQTIVTPIAPKAWVSNLLFTSLHTTKESLESKVYTNSNILQYRAMNRIKCRAFLLKSGQQSVLVLQGQRFLRLLVSILALGKQIVVQPATFFKHPAHLSGLLASREYPIEEGFTHLIQYRTNKPLCNL